MTADKSRIYFKKFPSDFIVVEKHGSNFCGTWDSTTLKPFVVEKVNNCEKPTFLNDEDLEKIQEVLNSKTDKYVVQIKDEDNTKENRKLLHVYIRQKYDNKLTSHLTENGIEVYISKNPKKEREEWPEGVGKFLHFTLKKTGHEGSYALTALARALGLHTNKSFNFAGSKDRRAITYQRVSIFKMKDKKLIEAQEKLSKIDIELSEFSHENDQVRFGAHDGNTFYILLRNADIDEEKFNQIKKYGCLNVFGPQRFGSKSINTNEIGLMILKEDYESAVNALLDPENAFSSQIKDLLQQYNESNDGKVLRNFPKSVEVTNEGILIKTLSMNMDKKDKYLLALQKLPMRNRSLYVHAYQSYIFNQFAQIYKEKHGIENCNGKEIPLPCGDVDNSYGEVYDIYNELLAKDGLTLDVFKSKENSFGIHLTKRDLVLMPENMKFRRIQHTDPDAEMIFYPPLEKDPDFGEGNQSVLLEFTLPSGGYATTILYELYGQHFQIGD